MAKLKTKKTNAKKEGLSKTKKGSKKTLTKSATKGKKSSKKSTKSNKTKKISKKKSGKLTLKKSNKTDVSIHGKEIAGIILLKYKIFRSGLSKIKKVQETAFDKMYDFGETLIEMEEDIKKEFGTWGKFADAYNINRQHISRCKASVEDFKANNADTLDKAKALLKERELEPSAKLMEQNVSKLLTEPKDFQTQVKQRKTRIEREKEELQRSIKRTQEIIDSHEPDEDFTDAVEVKNYLQESLNHLESLELSNQQYANPAYIKWCNSCGYDVLKGKAVKVTEAHHISPDGGTGSMGEKVTDLWAIPVAPDTHKEWHSGKLKLSREEIIEAQWESMQRFIMSIMPHEPNTEIAEAEVVK